MYPMCLRNPNPCLCCAPGSQSHAIPWCHSSRRPPHTPILRQHRTRCVLTRVAASRRPTARPPRAHRPTVRLAAPAAAAAPEQTADPASAAKAVPVDGCFTELWGRWVHWEWAAQSEGVVGSGGGSNCCGVAFVALTAGSRADRRQAGWVGSVGKRASGPSRQTERAVCL